MMIFALCEFLKIEFRYPNLQSSLEKETNFRVSRTKPSTLVIVSFTSTP